MPSSDLPTPAEDAFLARWETMLDANMGQLAQMHAAGVPVVAGTDAGWRFTPFDGLPEEMRLMADAGLPAMDVVQAATRRAGAARGPPGQGRDPARAQPGARRDAPRPRDRDGQAGPGRRPDRGPRRPAPGYERAAGTGPGHAGRGHPGRPGRRRPARPARRVARHERAGGRDHRVAVPGAAGRAGGPSPPALARRSTSAMAAATWVRRS